MSSTTIMKTVFFNAPCDSVWLFLTDKDKLGEWYHPADSDLEEGKDYRLFSAAEGGERKVQVWGRVIEMDRPNRLVTTFVIEPFKDKETTITWQLVEASGGTRLYLTHEGVAEATGKGAMQLLSALDRGWDDHFSSLRKCV